ncbi:hypothetical protein AKJ41_04925, partial [candidate division MSBL1 archaeon SCGC-AAA259O05]
MFLFERQKLNFENPWAFLVEAQNFSSSLRTLALLRRNEGPILKFYLDTSAWVKRYIVETGTQEMDKLFDLASSGEE